MNSKILYPIYGSQSLTAIVEHLKNEKMDYSARVNLAEALMKQFATTQFVVEFNPNDGAIIKVEPLKL